MNMTRKEEIQHKADEIFRKGDFGLLSDYEVATHVATETAEWADKTMLDKVCDYLSKLKFCKLSSIASVSNMPVFSEEDIEKLRKAMEEIDIPMVSPSAMDLQTYLNNSAPCSHCIFFKDLKCTFPENKKKECSQELGTIKGWNTKEYQRIPKDIDVNLIKEQLC